MASLFVLLALPAIVLARIDVELSGQFDGTDHSNLKVYYSGSQVGIITDTERNTFLLNDNNLKNSVGSYFGKRPEDAYLRSPTPWGDLYETYGWNQVIRTLVPKSGRVLSVTSKPTIVMKQVFENNSSRPGNFDVGIKQTVQNTVSSSWSKGGELSVGQEIGYGFELDAFKIGGKTSFSYTSSWGQSASETESITIGSSSGMSILLQPGQSVMAELHATRGSIKIEVEYEASLSGATAVNYGSTYRGHHFWALDIGAVMASGSLPNKKVSKEVIEIGFYSQGKIVVNDRALGTKVMEVGL